MKATFAADFAQARARDTELAGPIAPSPAPAPDPQADLRRMYVAAELASAFRCISVAGDEWFLYATRSLGDHRGT